MDFPSLVLNLGNKSEFLPCGITPGLRNDLFKVSEKDRQNYTYVAFYAINPKYNYDFQMQNHEET